MSYTRGPMIPSNISKVIELFDDLEYCLFKCEHLFSGANKNLDILFTDEDYLQAAEILKREGFVLYLSEKVEKYKQMWVKFSTSEYTRIHLHREIAWHGLKVIDKKDVFSHMVKNIPSNEDQLLIHVAHCVFENLYFKGYQLIRVKDLLSGDLDWDYLKNKVKIYNWEKEFRYVLSCVKNDVQPEKPILVQGFLKKAIKSPHCYGPLLKKSLNVVSRKFSLRRKGSLISLIGVNASGKTTLVDETLKVYTPLTNSVSGQKGFYFGYVPFTPWARLLSSRNKQKGKKVFEEVNLRKNSGWKDELFFLFNYIEYSFRYWLIIYPLLRKNKLVMTDRYFYDMYGQYNNAASSKILSGLIKIFPKPDHVFVLDAPLDKLSTRDKNVNVKSTRIVKSKVRTQHDKVYLAGQKERYAYLLKKVNGISLDTNTQLQLNINTIIEKSWRTLCK